MRRLPGRRWAVPEWWKRTGRRPTHDGSRSTLRQRDPNVGHWRCSAGQLRASGHADGHGPGGLRTLAASPALPNDPICQPRPVRAVDRAWLELLYSMLYLTGVKTVNPKYEALGAVVGRWTRPTTFASSTAVAPVIRC